MGRYLFFLFWFIILFLPALGQEIASNQAFDHGELIQQVLKDTETFQSGATRTVAVNFKLAELYLNGAYSESPIDSARRRYDQAYRDWKKLDKKEQKQLAKGKIDNPSFRQLKNEIRDRAVDRAFQTNTLAAFEHLQTLYPKLPGQLEQEVVKQRNRLALATARKVEDYKEVQAIYNKYQSDLSYYDPDIKKAFESLIFSVFFDKYDAANILNVLFFIREFPDLATQADSILSQAFEKKPYVELVENYLSPYATRSFPLTSEAIYDAYAASGKRMDLIDYAAKYPDFAMNEVYLTDLNKAKEAEYKLLSEFEDHLSSYIKAAAPSHRAFKALQMIISTDLEAKNWAAAAETVRTFVPYFGEEDEHMRALVTLLTDQSDQVKAEPIDSFHINTILEEYSPVITSDEQTLYFCRRGEDKENIFYSEKKGGKWAPPVPLAAINKPDQNEAPLAISSDGNTLLIFEEGKVKISNRTKKGWSTPENLFPPELQSPWQGGTTISGDKQVAIFAARRADRIGLPREENIDLYISIKEPDGSWGFPKNIGTTINTPFTDRSPFLHPDGRTLYFSSDGHGGFGDLDVFKTTRIGDGWTEWTKPVNLGKFINTTTKDWGYRVSTSGIYAYFSAEVEDKQEDLFQIKLPPIARPEPVSTIKGVLTDLGGQPIDGALLIEDLDADAVITTVQPDPNTGAFFITLPQGKIYSYVVKADGYFPVSGNIDLRKIATAIHEDKRIVTPKIDEMKEAGLTVTLNNLFFDHDEATIQASSFPELNRLADFLKTHQRKVEIAGHTDNTGTEAYNQDLSERRAEAVKQYLIGKGCSGDQIEAQGYGFTEPVADNSSEEGRAENRRVEIRFIEN